MMCTGKKLGAAINPIGAAFPKLSISQRVGKSVGGTAGMFIAPDLAFSNPEVFQKQRAQTVARNTATKKSKPTLITSEESDSATLIG